MFRVTPLMLAGGLLLGATLASVPASAANPAPLKAKDAKAIAVESPWVREAPPGARVLGAYMTLVNDSDRADRLLSVKSPLAGEIEIHRMTVKNGMMDMEAIPFLTIPAHGEVKLQPGGNHLMIYGMKRELKEGDRLPLELMFEHSGAKLIEAPVRKVMGKQHHHE
jgi:copper(I)-binding protein